MSDCTKQTYQSHKLARAAAPGAHWRRMPYPEPRPIRDAVFAFHIRHERRPRPLDPKYALAVDAR